VVDVSVQDRERECEFEDNPTSATTKPSHPSESRVFRSTMSAPDFDGVARAYQWMEYLSLGTMLERARFWALDAGWSDECRRALVLGDGDGRFTARLMGRNAAVRVHAVDLSGEMLRLLERRCRTFQARLSTTCADAREFSTKDGADLVVTHFFLDCLEQEEVSALVRKVSAGLAPGATWVVSEFSVPRGWLRVPAWLIVRGLYFAFRVLTDLRVTRLPDFALELRECGFGVVAEKRFLGGLLVSQVWMSMGPAS
jgi:ubiquinone/menaquinone biosynthesis C-methylase UbiE